MKTVPVSVRGLGAGGGADGSPEPRDLGFLDADAVAARLRALFGEGPAKGAPPVILLTGRDGARLEVRRQDGGLLLAVTGGGERAVSEDEAEAGVRAFVEAHGGEGPAPAAPEPPAATFRKLAPRGPAMGAAAVGIVIGASLGMATAGSGVAQFFAALPALAGIVVAGYLMTRTHDLTIDPRLGSITERTFGRRREVCRLDAVKHADAMASDRGLAGVVLRIPGGDRSLGYWPTSRAKRIAEVVNECIGLPEERRKLLRYRRESRS
ncbi:MAG: hypothetical protein MUE73_12295 [Planctomycetes bacterium]|jgi:hypothetical protein|nr:hypothetical protein [Planctomycetota bacterium]